VTTVTSDDREATNPDPERVGLKAQGIRALLAEWDPLGVTESDGSSDEYECLVWPLTRLLDREASAEQVASFLSSDSQATSVLTLRRASRVSSLLD
jgi:hypothetical protein